MVQKDLKVSAANQEGQASQAGSVKPAKRKMLLVVIIFLLLAVALAVAGVFVYRYWSQQQAYTELKTYVEVETKKESNVQKLADLSADWDALKKINPDIVAWIYIPGSPINYPVVKGPDNEKYLHTAFDGRDGFFSSAGTIFIDQKNDGQLLDRNTFFYGHHMRDGSMFAALDDWVTTPEFNKHRDMYILTPNGNYYAKMFTAIKTTGSDPIVETVFKDDEAFKLYLQKIFKRAIVEQTGEVFTPNNINQIFSLCTCEYTRNDGRDLFFATVVASTVPNDPWVPYDPDAETGLGKDQSTTFGTDNK